MHMSVSWVTKPLYEPGDGEDTIFVDIVSRI